jgi:phosphoglycolate phosphatase-like HAD superfamily hydrolase
VTPSILGPAPIVDFDGTLARLPVAWAELRAQLQIDCIAQLWQTDSPEAWSIVREAEIEAARRATPLEPVCADLENSTSFAVLTANSEDAVTCFLRRFTALDSRVAVIVGRETLAGPKHDYEVFRRGFTSCAMATAPARADGAVTYAGDTDWELEFARRLGAEAVDARRLNAGR